MECLSKLMSEEYSWRNYNQEISMNISNGTPCIIFLGVFLSYVVRYETLNKLKKGRKSRESLKGEKKFSMNESYTVLEAITVRHRLQKISGSFTTSFSMDSDIEEEGEPATILTENDDESSDHDDSGVHEEGHTWILPKNDRPPLQKAYSQHSEHPILEPTWSKDVLRQVDSLNTPLKRGMSLEQLLDACQDIEDESTIVLTRSHSMPEISDDLEPLQQHFESEAGQASPSGNASSSHSANCAEDEFVPTIQTEVISAEASAADTTPDDNERGSTSSSECVSSGSEDRVHLGSLRQASTSSLQVHHVRKRHTTSDEMHTLQLHIAQSTPSKEPEAMLSQYQWLSLSYSSRFTSSTITRAMLETSKPNSVAVNYKRSYMLEPWCRIVLHKSDCHNVHVTSLLTKHQYYYYSLVKYI